MLNIRTIGVAAVGAAAIGLSVGSAAPAEAASFGFSYTFLSGQTLSGTVDGVLQADNNTVRNLSDLSATYSGQPGTLLSFLSSPPGFFTLSGTPGFSFMGFANNPNTATPQPNFGFALGNPSLGNGATVGTFQTAAGITVFPLGANRREGERFAASRWRASQITTPVPTPALLPGLVGMGVAAFRKKRKNEQSQQVAEAIEV